MPSRQQSRTAARRGTQTRGTRRPTRQRRPPVSAEEIAVLAKALFDAAASNGLEQPLQLDFLGGKGRGVLRVRGGERVWLKVAEGPWRPEVLPELIRSNLVQVDHQARLGATLHVKRELVERFTQAAGIDT